MALTVGTDTYISQTDATTYVGANYPTTSSEYIAWVALSTGDKDLYLKKACKRIDRQVLKGVKAIETQTLEFPRALRTDYYSENYETTSIRHNEDWIVEQAVAQTVKDAQVEEALALLTKGTEFSKRAELQAQGVKSFSLGSLSESYSKGAVSGTQLLSQEAKELMRYYLNGSVIII
jgi:hypothetical protein